MLQVDSWLDQQRMGRSPVKAFASRPDPMRELLLAFRRNRRALALWSLACLGVALVWLTVTPVEYSSSAVLVLDPRKPSSGAQSDMAAVPGNIDSAQIESQVQVAKSGQVLRFVFDEMGLKDDPEYNPRSHGLLDRLFGSKDAGPADWRAEANSFAAFSDRVTVRRLGQSLALEISFRSKEAKRAAMVANAIAAAYIRDQIESRSLAMRRSGEWLQNRIEDLAAQNNAATEAVRRGLAPTAAFPASDARLISAATEPLSKAYPQRTLVLGGALAFALLTGLGAVAIQQSLDRTMHTREQVRRELDIECLGVVPISSSLAGIGGRPAAFRDSATRHDAVADGHLLQAIQGAVIGNAGSKGLRIIGFVSVEKEAGASMLATRLAHLFAMSGCKTALIDADVAHAKLAELSDVEQPAAAAESRRLVGSSVRSGSIAAGLTYVAAAAMVSSDSAEPTVFLPSVKRVLEAVRSLDQVIVDLPSLDTSSIAHIVAPLLDAVVVVVEARRTSIERAADAIDSLRLANVPVLGIVLNKSTGI